MKNLISDVRAFHEACGIPLPDKLGFPAWERVELRAKLVKEEYVELMLAIYGDRATAKRDIASVADALADLIYVSVGMALEFGIPLDRVWDEVQRSNMAKRDPVTGKVLFREDGKVLKPKDWTPPNIAGALA